MSEESIHPNTRRLEALMDRAEELGWNLKHETPFIEEVARLANESGKEYPSDNALIIAQRIIDELEGWKKARKKPVIIEFREVKGEKEEVSTKNGIVIAKASEDYVARGIMGELYPINKKIFNGTYEVIQY